MPDNTKAASPTDGVGGSLAFAGGVAAGTLLCLSLQVAWKRWNKTPSQMFVLMPTNERPVEKRTGYLVGAGPGSVGLLTLRGMRLVQSADVLIYDDLADPAILDSAPEGCIKVYVGKRVDMKTSSKQEDINDILVRHCREDKVVVRLKGGDPMVFGRVLPEILALKAAGLPYEIVPGVTSILSAVAALGIPVTEKYDSKCFAVLSGHKPDDMDWEPLAKIDTLLMLMATKKLEIICKHLVQNGRDPSTPVGIVQWSHRPEQLTLQGTLSTIVEMAKGKSLSPAIVIVGKVAAADYAGGEAPPS